jgi:antitoxin component YwqK of YwqJK toxin-antitoxin module
MYEGCGDKHGLWTFFYESGQRECAGEYVVGFESGVWSFWHRNGQLRARGAIDGAGDKAGEWQYWDEAGEPMAEAEYLARYPVDSLASWPPRRVDSRGE